MYAPLTLSSRRDAAHQPCSTGGVSRFRRDSASTEVYPESAYLRGWARFQARRYRDLLLTIEAATRRSS